MKPSDKDEALSIIAVLQFFPGTKVVTCPAAVKEAVKLEVGKYRKG